MDNIIIIIITAAIGKGRQVVEAQRKSGVLGSMKAQVDAIKPKLREMENALKLNGNDRA